MSVPRTFRVIPQAVYFCFRMTVGRGRFRVKKKGKQPKRSVVKTRQGNASATCAATSVSAKGFVVRKKRMPFKTVVEVDSSDDDTKQTTRDDAETGDVKLTLDDDARNSRKRRRVSFAAEIIQPPTNSAFLANTAEAGGVNDSILSKTSPSRSILKKLRGNKPDKLNAQQSLGKKAVPTDGSLDKSENNASSTAKKTSVKTAANIHLHLKMKNKSISHVQRQLGQKEKELEAKVSAGNNPIAARKLLKLQRVKRKLMKNPNYDVVISAKRIWELVRNSKTKAERREELIEELFSLVKGKVSQFLQAHDAVRIIQCLMALKRADIRDKLFEEVRDDFLSLSKRKYAKFFVEKMLKYGTSAQRQHVLKCFYGHVVGLLRHAVAADCVEFAYNSNFANALQRSHLSSEFYGAEFAVFKSDDPMNLSKALDQATSEMKKDSILNHLRDNLLSLTSKPALRHTIVHHVAAEYFQLCGSDQRRREMVDALKERVVEMVHTRPGVYVAMCCIWHGNVRERKIVIKSLKGLAVKCCLEEYAYFLLVAIFDCVDDTVLVSKIILQEMKKRLSEIAASPYGLKVLQFLLSPRNGRFIRPVIMKFITEGDAFTSAVGKKDKSVRSRELLEHMSPSLIAFAAEHLKELLFDPHKSLLVLSIAQQAIGDKTKLYESIADIIAEEFFPGNVESFHLIEHPQGHFVLKMMLRLDKALHEAGEPTLAGTLASRSVDFASWICCNKGAFVLIQCLETGIPAVVKAIRTAITASTIKRLKEYSFPAANILLAKLADA